MVYAAAGAVVAILVFAGAALGIVYKMHKSNRADLKRQLQVEKELAEKKRDIAGYKRSISDLEDITKEKDEQLEREKAARDHVVSLLGNSRWDGITATGVNDALDLLSKLPGVSTPEASDSQDG